MDKTQYWCPKCGLIFTGAIAYRKHVNSKKCKQNQKKLNTNDQDKNPLD